MVVLLAGSSIFLLFVLGKICPETGIRKIYGKQIRAYHKLTIRISGYLLLRAGTFMIPRAKKFGVEGL